MRDRAIPVIDFGRWYKDGGIFVGLEPELPRERTTTDVMAGTMVNWGVKRVFGMVGHSNLGLAEAIRHRSNAGELHFVGVRHEGAAAFAASAYGKLTNRPAACLTTAGPSFNPIHKFLLWLIAVPRFLHFLLAETSFGYFNIRNWEDCRRGNTPS